MPFWNVIRIIPAATLAAWQSATSVGGDADGLNATTDVYTEADPTPRTSTHEMGNSSMNAQQFSLLDGAGVDVNGYVQVENIDAGLAGCLVKVWDRSLGLGANPGNAMLSENGLTTSST